MGGGAAVGGAVGFDDPPGLGGEGAEDVVDVGAAGEVVAAVLPEALHDLRSDRPPQSLPQLRFLPLPLRLPLFSSDAALRSSSAPHNSHYSAVRPAL